MNHITLASPSQPATFFYFHGLQWSQSCQNWWSMLDIVCQSGLFTKISHVNQAKLIISISGDRGTQWNIKPRNREVCSAKNKMYSWILAIAIPAMDYWCSTSIFGVFLYTKFNFESFVRFHQHIAFAVCRWNGSHWVRGGRVRCINMK